MGGGQAVSEEYEMPSQPLYHYHDSIRVSAETSQLDAGANLWEDPIGE